MLIVEHVFLRLNLQKAVLIAENVNKSCIEVLRVTEGQLIKRARQARCFMACFFRVFLHVCSLFLYTSSNCVSVCCFRLLWLLEHAQQFVERSFYVISSILMWCSA